MGLLTADQKTAIAAGAPVRQVFKLYGPTTSGGDPTVEYLLHDDDGGPLRVTNAGRRTVEAYNVSMKEPGRLGLSSYTIVCHNSDGYLSPYKEPLNAWQFETQPDPPIVRQAQPRECLLKHQVYVLVAGAWSEITGVAYTGRILEPRFDVKAGTWLFDRLVAAGKSLRELTARRAAILNLIEGDKT